MATINNARIQLAAGELKLQSPYLYLQSVGSTQADGSAYGAHVRWMLLRNLGESHLPKGDAAATTVNFNRSGDYVTLFRSRYLERFPTIVDFSVPPDVVNDALLFWIYTTTNTNTVVYIHFRDVVRYAAVRAGVDPATQTLRFLQQYCPALIEAEVKDKLFFAVEFDVARTAATVMRAEGLSVEANVPLSPFFVSCRKTFTNERWCPPDPPGTAPPRITAAPTEVTVVDGTPACCEGPNLIPGSFVPPATAGFPFETDYVVEGGASAGAINITTDAHNVNPGWVGLPHSGENFLSVDGSTTAGMAVLRFMLAVERETDYCFSGWLSTLFKGDLAIPLDLRFTAADGTVRTLRVTTPAAIGVWEPFSVTWSSGTSGSVKVEIISASLAFLGNDFGIDDLWFCKARRKQEECRARLCSENIRSVRFDVHDGTPRALRFETYQDYIANAPWQTLDKLALTMSDADAFARLEPAPGSVDGRWQKFNDNALLKVANYQDRWTRAGGLRQGVQQYIALSNNDPLAVATLPGAVQPQDGSVDVSLLDALRLVSLDFHVARMFGLGYLDGDIQNDADEFVYLAAYETAGPLDDTNLPRPVAHYYMGVPTSPLDQRLPDRSVLKPVTYGLTVDNGEAQPSLLTDTQGYTPDGLSRYVNLFVEPDVDTAPLGPFFFPPDEFCSTEKTASVFYGVEYRKQGETAWRKPEIAHDRAYMDLDTPPHNETAPLPNNNDASRPIMRHDERENGIHEYAAYGINWFSRVSPVGNIVATDSTVITKAARLLPPVNFAVQLIQPESPLMLTTAAEQDMLAHLSGSDKTLVRVTFDYDHVHDINHQFADTVELFFRPELPRNVVGAVKSVIDDPADSRRAIVRTTGYVVNSQGATVAPALDATLFGNFVGGVLTCQQQNYTVTDVAASTVAGEGPIFTVQKIVRGNPSDPGGTGTFVTVQETIAPAPSSTTEQLMFMAVENMADPISWGTSNPLTKTIIIGDSTWTTRSESYVENGDTVTITVRGVLGSATVTAESPAGVYRIAFDTYALQRHPQSGEADPVEWYRGVARLPAAVNPAGPKKVLEVLLVEHLGDGQPLVLHALDNDPGESVATGAAVTVNYYPGYKVYLHADAARNFTAAAILPAAGEGNRKTWLAARSRNSAGPLFSPVGIPAPIIALEFVEPLPPEQPSGAEFATWPDFYYKSSYTFTVGFGAHKPYAVAMYRSNDEAILRALYKNETYDAVREQLRLLGDDDPFRADRWKNLLGFDYASTSGLFRSFPGTGGYAFPNPDKGGPLNGSAPGTILADLREAVWGAFTALTEMPLIYDFIKGPSSTPVPKAQNIRDAQGTLLPPNDPAFDMAPMAKKTGNGFEIQFTDFTLDGTANNIFFYLGREIGNRGRLGEPGPIAGPVRLVNTRPPDSPAVKKMHVQEADLLSNTGPSVRFEINAYPEVQKVRRMLIYRTTDAATALSVRTMQLVKTVDLAQTNQLGRLSIFLADDFEDGAVPFGDPLFYRIVAQRQVNNPEGGSNWAPSQPSKLLLTTVMDSVNPEAPEITFSSDGFSGAPLQLTGVKLSWSPTRHNGTYYLDKMTGAGSWKTIYRIKTNQSVTVDLAATDLGTNVLPKANDDGRTVYHRFRVRVENASGLFSRTDKVLTI